MASKYCWLVFSTALNDGVLMLICENTGSFGIVRNPTRREWEDAFDAPSKPYRWKGGYDLVEVQKLVEGKWVKA